MRQEVHEAYWVPYAIKYTIKRDLSVSSMLTMRCGVQLSNKTRCTQYLVADPDPAIKHHGYHFFVVQDNNEE